MKRSARSLYITALALVAALAMGAAGRSSGAEAPRDGVALVIVYDTSGSMQQKVRDADGQLTPKHVIAKRTLKAVLDRLQAVTSGSEEKAVVLHSGLVVFEGNRAQFAVKFGPFRVASYRHWLNEQGPLTAGTPLGEAVRMAGEAVLQSRLSRKHVLVITDGVNTRGPDPVVTIPKLQSAAGRAEAPLSIHFVAFDVNANVFAGVKKLGATVVGASDEKQLNSQIQFILEKKILLEDEEPLPAKNSTP